MDIIEPLQKRLDTLLQETPYHELNYTTIVTPLIKEALTTFEERKLKIPSTDSYKLPVDLYTEIVTHIVVNKYLTRERVWNVPHEGYVLMLIRYPYFINILQSNRTFNEYLKFRAELVDTLDTMFPVKSNQVIIHVRNLLTTDIATTYDIRTCSSVHYFHYLMCFRFSKEYVAVTKDRLPIGDDVSYFVINLTYNLDNPKSIIIYTENPKIKNKILNPFNIPKYKCIHKPEKVIKAKLPFHHMNTQFEEIEYHKSKVYILLCYNDNEDLTKCHFTVALFDEAGYVDSKFINNFINGWIPFTISKNDVYNCINTTFMKSFSQDPAPIKEITNDCNIITKIACRAFDAVRDSGITDIRLFDAMANEIISDPELLDVVDSTELPFLKLYLGNMMSTYSVYIDMPNLKDMLASYVRTYIHSDILDDNTFHD